MATFWGGFLISACVVAVWATFHRFVLRCQHPWMVVSEKEFPPILEDMKKNGLNFTFYDSDEVIRVCRRKYVSVVSCDKCGSIRTFEFHS